MDKGGKEEFETYSLQKTEVQMKLFLEALGTRVDLGS